MTMFICGLNPRQIVALIILIQCARICASVEADVSLQVEGNGFHRTLVYRVDFKNLTNKDCRAAIYMELPSALYVNVDEIAELRRQGSSTVCSVGETNVELFMEKADPQNVTACASVHSSVCTLRIPVHQRYQNAKEDGGYVDVILPRPKLLLGCRDRVRDRRVSKIDLCEPCVGLAAKWREIPYGMAKNHDYTWPIPVGNSSLLPFVSFVTLLTANVAAVFIGRAIWTNASKKRQKTD